MNSDSRLDWTYRFHDFTYYIFCKFDGTVYVWIILMLTVAQKIVQLFQQEVFETSLICKKSQRLSNIYSERWKNFFSFWKIVLNFDMCYQQKQKIHDHVMKT